MEQSNNDAKTREPSNGDAEFDLLSPGRLEQLRLAEKTIPGLSEAILRELERRAEHRRELERVQAERFFRIALRGQVMASLLVGIAIVSGVLISMVGDSAWAHVGGSALGVGGMVSIVALLITGKRK